VTDAGGGEERRVAWLPLEEHTPRSVEEAGLDLPPPRSRWWRVGAIAALVVVVAVAGGLLLRRSPASTSVLDLDAGSCYSPVITDVGEPIDGSPCEPGAARLVTRQRHPAGADEVHPGDGALELFGQGACQGRVDDAALVVAVPSPAAWAAGQRVIACSERL